jgi:hypothetical protein
LLSLDEALLAAYRGDAAEANAAIASLSEATTGSGDPTTRAWHRRALSVVRLMAGDIGDAFEEGMRAIEEEPGGPNASIAMWCAGRAALWLRDAGKVRAALEREPGEEGGWQASARRALEAGLAALEGHPREAAAAYETFLAERFAKGDRLTHALATVDAVAVLPPDLVPEGAVESARDYLEELGARPLLDRLAGADVADVHDA